MIYIIIKNSEYWIEFHQKEKNQWHYNEYMQQNCTQEKKANDEEKEIIDILIDGYAIVLHYCKKGHGGIKDMDE